MGEQDLGTMLVGCGCDARVCPESCLCSSAACSEG